MRKTLREQLAGKCVHFNGTMNVRCRAGVRYDSVRVRADDGKRVRLPCLFECETCAKVERPTKESIEARVAEMRKAMDDSMRVREAIVARLGPAKKGVSTSGIMSCPACGKGEVQYSRSGSNGAIVASCSTSSCVSWIE